MRTQIVFVCVSKHRKLYVIRLAQKKEISKRVQPKGSDAGCYEY